MLRRLLYVLVVLALCLPVFVPAEQVAASGEVHVQRGSVSATSGTATVFTYTLATPVPVGKSWLMFSLHSSSSTLSRSCFTGELVTVVDDEYTQVRFTRVQGFSHTMNLRWQVIWGDSFTVQSGTRAFSDSSATQTVNIDAVDLSSTFVVTSLRGTEHSNLRVMMVRARLTSSTQIELRVNTVTSTAYPTVHWQVI